MRVFLTGATGTPSAQPLVQNLLVRAIRYLGSHGPRLAPRACSPLAPRPFEEVSKTWKSCATGPHKPMESFTVPLTTRTSRGAAFVDLFSR